MPNDWKTATVTPLYKRKGSNLDMNNYRGISVLVPFVKIFEKILAEQIVEYFSEHNLLFVSMDLGPIIRARQLFMKSCLT